MVGGVPPISYDPPSLFLPDLLLLLLPDPEMALVDLFLGLMRAFVLAYDVVTYPVYRLLVERPSWEEKTRQRLGRVECTRR